MKTIRVAAAVIVENHKIFAARRGYGEFKGRWEFPGGKIEKDEKPEDALQREIKEELAADIAVDQFLGTVDYDYPDPDHGMLPLPRGRRHPHHPGTLRLPVGQERRTGKSGLAWRRQDSSGMGEGAENKPVNSIWEWG